MSQNNHSHKIAYSIKEACEASSLGRTTIYAHISAGRLKVTKIGGRTVVLADSLIDLLTQGGNPKITRHCSSLRGIVILGSVKNAKQK
jgi:excisionase family DNA binding protein